MGQQDFFRYQTNISIGKGETMYKGQGVLDKLDPTIRRKDESRMRFMDMHSKSDKNCLVLMAVDPNKVYGYWDFDEETKNILKAKRRNVQGVLELHSTSGKRDIPVNFSVHRNNQMNYYFKDLESYVQYKAVLRIPELNLSIESNPVETPKNFVSP